MRFDVVTLFPDFFSSSLSSGLLGKALAKGIAEVHLVNPRDFTIDKHHRVDDETYGGGVGMLMKPEPIFAAVESLPVLDKREIIFMTPSGETLKQPLLKELVANYNQLVIICGHYEGVDERVRQYLCTDEISIGNYVLTGGELPAMVIMDSVSRLIPGMLPPGIPENESHANGLLEYPHYTRPAEYRGWRVPDVLLNGNHAHIERWRREQSELRTQQRRGTSG